MTIVANPDKRPDRIATMFDAIAPRYDLLNRVLSAGIDRRWRRKAIESLHLTGAETVLDVCAGTADVALEAIRGGAAKVLGVDFASAMLAVGRTKVRAAAKDHAIALAQGDATRLPVRSSSVDAVTIAFGIRNVERPDAACAEIARALKPGGRIAILEFGVPRIPGIGTLYLWYFKYLLPVIGRAVSRHRAAYSYLPASVATFPSPDTFCATLRACGFHEVVTDPLTFGIVCLYTAYKA